MKKDYHIHAMVLRESVDSEAYIQEAIRRGFGEICITDHMPLSCSAAKDRIPAGQVSEYCRRVAELAEAYKDRICVKCGIEVDYHPSAIPEIEAVLQCGKFDYVLGSSHLHVFKHLGWFGPGATRSGYAMAMLENTVRAAESGYFNAIAHVDMYRWIFSIPERFPLADDGFREEDCQDTVEAALTAIGRNGLRLEVNPHFAEATGSIGDTYPGEFLTRKALDMGIPFCFGSDAHSAGHVGTMYEQLKQHPLYGTALGRWEEMP